MGEYLLKLVVLTAGIYTLYHWTLRGCTFFRFNRFFLLGGMVLALLLPWIPLRYEAVLPILTATADHTYRLGNVATVSVHPSSFLPQLLGVIYVAGVCLMLTLRSYGVWRLCLSIRQGKRTRQPGYTLLEGVATSPFTFMWYIFLPAHLQAEDRKAVLAHERAHVEQRHYIDLWIGECFCILQWFNPLAWMYRKCVIENQEFVADRKAVSEVGMNRYKETLVSHWIYGSSGAMVHPFAYSTRLMRMSMMKKPASPPSRMLGCLLMLPLLGVYGSLFALPASGADASLTLRGRVTDESGKSMVGAAVVFPSEHKGTLSDMDGVYVLPMTGQEDTLLVSMRGYESQRIALSDCPVKDGQVELDIRMNALKRNFN